MLADFIKESLSQLREVPPNINEETFFFFPLLHLRDSRLNLRKKKKEKVTILCDRRSIFLVRFLKILFTFACPLRYIQKIFPSPTSLPRYFSSTLKKNRERDITSKRSMQIFKSSFKFSSYLGDMRVKTVSFPFLSFLPSSSLFLIFLKQKKIG